MKTRPLFLALLAGASLAVACQGKQPPGPAQKPAADAGAATPSVADAGVVAPREDPAPVVEAPKPTSLLACKLEIDAGGALVLGGKPFARPEGLDPRATLVAHPLTTAEVLIAAENDWSANPQPDGRLWKVACDKVDAPSVFMKLEGADFGHAAINREADRLYFTTRDGVGVLDLAARTWERVIDAQPLPEGCAVPTGHHGKAMDVVVSRVVSGNKLVLHRGGPCGVNGLWTAHEIHLIRPEDKARRLERTPRPVSSVARTADGAIWIGDAGRCQQPGVIDVQTSGTAFVSKDNGTTWEERKVKAGAQQATTAIKTLIADPRDPRRLLAYTTRCQAGEQVTGGTVYQTRNGGQSWEQLKLPADLKATGPDQRLYAVEVRDDNLDSLIIWEKPDQRWETTDGGRSWKSMSPGGMLPRKQGRIANDDTHLYRATSSGLLRKDETTKRLERVWPPRQ